MYEDRSLWVPLNAASTLHASHFIGGLGFRWTGILNRKNGKKMGGNSQTPKIRTKKERWDYSDTKKKRSKKIGGLVENQKFGKKEGWGNPV